LTGWVPPSRIGLVWIIVPLIGLAGSVLISRGRRGREGLRWGAGFFAIFCFIAATYAIMRPVHGAQYQVYPVLSVALAYALYGVMRLIRYLWIGAALFVLALIGYFFLQPWLPYWLAAVGGGGLILGGLWLRKA
jgi:hypothetical protein